MGCSSRHMLLGLLLILINMIAVSDGKLMLGNHRRRLQQDRPAAVMVEVLRELKMSISHDPLGITDSWDVTNSTADPCRSKWGGLTCNDQGELIGIDLSSGDRLDQKLTATLTPSLSLLPLTSLTLLDLSQNNVTLSSDFSSLSCLIPPSLRILNLSYTNMVRDNDQHALSRLLSNLSSTSLQQIWLDGTDLSGSLPQQLASLQVGRSFPMLQTLSLSYNSLTGALSSAAQQLSSCQWLRHVDLSHNKLAGTLDGWCYDGGNVSVTLTYLDVSYNKLQGVIPEGLGNCSALQHLDLAFNVGLWGAIPASLPRSCRNLTFFSVVETINLSGSLPAEFALLSRLDSLLLEGNNFSGAPLPVLLNCTSLRTIHFFGNLFQGHIPPDLCIRLPYLSDLVLGRNTFTGDLPPNLSNCSFVNLMLGFNKFSGSISGKMLGKWKQLHRQLDLQHNNFVGNIPPEIGNLTNLAILILNNNKFSGKFPQEMGLLSSLEGATFEHNSFTGSFPGQIFNCTKLMHLIIHDNSLQGPLPSSIGLASQLTYLEAQNNLLSGNLPDALSNCTQLQNFSLAHNLLTGSIPAYLASLSSILFLFSLSHNNFSGVIPAPGFGNMFHMQDLDLSHNKLSGPLPAEISLCESLLSLNLAANALEEGIPSSLGSPTMALTLLNLSFNFLNGNIPSSLGNLRTLQELDLSNNQLDGLIPATLATAPSLVFLNLSYNNLEGMVPGQGRGVFRYATADSFLGNPLLCGEIMYRSCTARPDSLFGKKAFRIGLIAGAVLLLFLLLLIVGVYKHWALQHSKTWLNFPKSNLLKLSLHEIQEATNNFSKENLIGTGASGSVYKGFMPDGKVLAFKKFTMESGSVHAFFQELQTIRQAKHRNLIKILGYWSNHKDENILILEYMQNGSLEDHLHSIHNEARACKLTWTERLHIAIEIAEGLLYLHEHCANSPIVHCDIKPSNILLDANMHAHISDFGLAKIVVDMVTTTQNLHGTLGYMAPECASFGQISPKCDVYSFGIIMLELLSGIQPTNNAFLGDDMTLMEWTRLKIKANLICDVLDESMRSVYNKEWHVQQITPLLNVALECTSQNPRGRPTMRQVLDSLQAIENMQMVSYDGKKWDF